MPAPVAPGADAGASAPSPVPGGEVTGGQIAGAGKQAGGEAGARVLVLSGPNLHRLGKRQPEIYGHRTLAQIHEQLHRDAQGLGVAVECRQSNHEGELVDWVGAAQEQGFSGIVINPGAYTHTSYALYDALLGAGIPSVEVHLSNPEAREGFRRRSRTAPACVGKVAGFGEASYLLGLRGLLVRLPAASAAPNPSGAPSRA